MTLGEWVRLHLFPLLFLQSGTTLVKFPGQQNPSKIKEFTLKGKNLLPNILQNEMHEFYI